MQYVKAIYYREHEKEEILTGVNNRLLENLIENGIQEDWYEDKGHSRLMSFDIKELAKANTDDKEMIELIRSIQNGELISCSYCHAVILNYHPYIYRDNHGSIGRSYECYDCRGLLIKDATDVGNICRDKGQKEAMNHINKIYE